MSTAKAPPIPLSWLGIIRLGLVQTSLGAIIVLTTSTVNRVMVVEMALPAMLPGILVGWHYALQVLRPRWGYGSDLGRRLTPWIIGGMAVLALGGFLSAVSVALMAASTWAGIALSVVAFTLIGIGVGAAGTSLLVLLSKRVQAERRPAAATIVWLMMIAGFALTAFAVGHALDPFSLGRLVAVSGILAVLALAVATLAVLGIEGHGAAIGDADKAAKPAEKGAFMAALGEVWREPKARLFAIFIFVSMLAYSGQDLILEPFAGAVFGLTPGGSTKLSGVQHSGVFLGMILVAVAGRALAGSMWGSPVAWTIGGCLASAVCLAALAAAGSFGPDFPLRAVVFGLGLSNGAYAGAAIGAMMGLASQGRGERDGTRMGLWGAAQAIAFGIGGFLGTVAVDVARYLVGSPLIAYASVFAAEAVLFVIAAMLAAMVARMSDPVAEPATPTTTDIPLRPALDARA